MNREQKEWRKQNPKFAIVLDKQNKMFAEICKLYRSGKNEFEISIITRHSEVFVSFLLKKFRLK